MLSSSVIDFYLFSIKFLRGTVFHFDFRGSQIAIRHQSGSNRLEAAGKDVEATHFSAVKMDFSYEQLKKKNTPNIHTP